MAAGNSVWHDEKRQRPDTRLPGIGALSLFLRGRAHDVRGAELVPAGYIAAMAATSDIRVLVCLLRLAAIVHIFLCLRDDDARERDERDEVRDGHEAVDDVREDPDGFELEERAGGDEHDEDEPVGQHALRAEEVDAGALAVVVPAEDRREREEYEREREQAAADAAIRRHKRAVRHRRARGVALPDAREDEREARHRADDDRIDERARHRDEALLRRPLRLRGRRGDRRGAEAGLIGEDAARDAVLHRHHDRRAGEAADGRLARERILEDERDGRRQLVDVDDDESDADCDVEECHERDDLRCDARDGLEAADRDRRDEERQDRVRRRLREAERELHAVDDGVDLRERADAEKRHADAREREERRERLPFLAHAISDIEHRAAGDLAFLIDRAVLDREQALGILRRHAEERRHPHPEDRARAADLHCRRDADDIARADRRRERHAERLEARDVALALVLRAEDQLERERQAEHLQEMQPHRQEDARADEQRDERRAPHERINRIEYGDEKFHTYNLLEDTVLIKRTKVC